jgi:hypothetical protein
MRAATFEVKLWQERYGALRAGLPPIRTRSGPAPGCAKISIGTSHHRDGRRTIREARHAFTQ